MRKNIKLSEVGMTSERLLDMYVNKRMSFASVAKLLGVDPTVVMRWTEELNVRRYSPTKYEFYLRLKDIVESNSKSVLLTTSEEYQISPDNSRQQVKVRCPCTEVFEVDASTIVSNQKLTCTECSIKNRFVRMRDEFNQPVIDKIIEMGQDFIKVVGDDNERKIHAKCLCGRFYSRQVNHFKVKDKWLCYVCENGRENTLSYEDIDTYIKNESECELVEKISKSDSKELKLRCCCGEIFVTSFTAFKASKSKSCEECWIKVAWNMERIKAFLVDNDIELTVLEAEYHNTTAWMKFKCKCGEVFNEKWNRISTFAVSVCIECRGRVTKGERKIINVLEREDVDFEYAQTITDDEDMKRYSFDFKIEDKILIEYDGQQHFYPVNFGGASDEGANIRFIKDFKRDIKKNEYAINKDFTLVRIPYWNFDQIEDIVLTVLAEHNLVEVTERNQEIELHQYIVSGNWRHADYQKRDKSNKAKTGTMLLKGVDE